MWRTLWPRGRQKPVIRKPARFRPRVEVLEGRWLPSTLTVTTTADSGPGSLRAELAAAKSGDTIVFDPSLDGQTITLTSGQLAVNKSVTIQGPGAGLLTITGDNLSRVFDVKAKQTVVISGMTITGGNGIAEPGATHTFDGEGGAILDLGNLTLNGCTVTGNSASTTSQSVGTGGGIAVGRVSFGNSFEGTLTVNDCIISGNSSVWGGGIYDATTATISNSVVSGNSALYGGGIFDDASNRFSATLTVSGDTLSANSASNEGGGIYISSGGAATVSTSSFCSNTPDAIFGTYTDGGGNTFC
jgi:hypothetical protein